MEILIVALCYRNRDKHQSARPLGSYAHFTYKRKFVLFFFYFSLKGRDMKYPVFFFILSLGLAMSFSQWQETEELKNQMTGTSISLLLVPVFFELNFEIK